MKNVFAILLVSLSTSVVAQKIKLIEGDLSPLKGQTSIKTEFKYDMSVGKFDKEDDYIAQKKKELNEKEPDRGDSWEKNWKADRQDRFEPQFRELFSKHSEMSTTGDNAKYTLIFKTVHTEPGFNVHVMSKPAYIDAEAWIVEAQNPNKVIAKITITKALGRDVFGFDYETGLRLQEAYAKAGKELGGFIRKNAK
ncbi:MAG TPA: hypothetical protein VE467_13170 [Chryseolinea sp.]|jgi:hypothetical protein|nr:hypothetical protein [Chryseolinea sp.]